MSTRTQIETAARGSRLRRVAAACLVAFASLVALPAWAINCSDLPNGTLDGFAGDIPPSQIQIDQTCTIRNFPASNPLTTNFSFYTQPGQTDERWLIIFDNVYHTGQMACNSVAGHKIWFTNGSSSTIQEDCQNLLIPVEKIDKKNPAGDTATVGVPFTYRLTMPVLYDPATQAVIDFEGSANDLHGITVVDDLNAIRDTYGVELTYVSHEAHWASSGATVPHTFSNVGGVLTFDNFPIVPSGEQIYLDITVVLDATPANAIGDQFVNVAKWDFGRLIDGVFYEPLPGEWGTSDPMTIAGPELVLDKSGPAALNLGQAADFTLDVRNDGLSDAWNVTLLDRLANGADGGMCELTPTILSAQVYAADGSTPVPGKGPLTEGVDYSFAYSGEPTCELRLVMLSPAAVIGPGERLIIRYRTSLDPDTQQGASLTNIAGAIEWFNGDTSATGRQAYSRTLTDGTVGVDDHQDAHTVLADLSGYVFEKRVANLTSGADPALVANPGDTLRYTLYVRTLDAPLVNARILDDLGSLNPDVVFEPGSLSWVLPTPAGVDVSNTDPDGGTNGAGLVDVRSLDLPIDANVTLQFDVTLAAAIDNGTVITNQAELLGVGKIADSDDPTVNGQSDPEVAGDEDPTRVVIESAPYFDVNKVSTYLDGDPNVLLAGERLRYTVTVANVGTEDATDATLRDDLPANTTYVAGSTALNGSPVPDLAGGGFPLTDGIDLWAPGDPTPGVLGATPTPAADTTATLTFEVTVDPDVADATVISNQAFVSALTSSLIDQPSDDPRTAAVDDPTQDVVGNFPLIFPVKTAALLQDYDSPGIVDPGDVLRYTIIVQNNGPVPASMARIADVVPTDTTYVADTLTLNGEPVGQPDGGVFPLEAGVWLSSSDLTPPLPGPGEGVISSREAATIQFDVQVNANVPRGTLITNQATVSTDELGEQLTDGDGNPATGPEPTIVVVGDAQQLTITKQVSVVGGGPALAGSTLEYLVTVRNTSAVPALDVYVTDNLDEPTAGQLLYVDDSATLNGGTAGIGLAGPVITANYSAQYGALPPGQAFVLRFRAQIYDDAPIGTTVINQAFVTWNTDQTASAEARVDVGGMPGVGILNGQVWHDSDFDDYPDPNETSLEGWSVELRRNDQLLTTVTTDADGIYQISGLVPNYLTGDRYDLTFRAPGAGAGTATLGMADSDFTNAPQRIYDIVVPSGSNLQNLNMPIDPNGVVYDALSRLPVAGATLRLVDSGSLMPVASDCFDDPNQQGQVTPLSGFYKFDLNFSDPTCPSGGSYVIAVTPAASYEDRPSELIPPTTDSNTVPFNVPFCPGSVNDAVPTTGSHCEAQVSELQPSAAVPATSPETRYFLNLVLDDGVVPGGTSQIFNNHIPLDPVLSGLVTISKTTPMVNVTRGQMIPYTITVRSSWPIDMPGVNVVDRYPTGFKYVEGSARFDGVPLEPVQGDRELVWEDLTLAAESEHTIELLLTPGAGVVEAEYTNRARAELAQTGQALSSEATATVRLVPDPTFDCTDVTGKVFNDNNRNGLQDEGEQGIPGTRLVTPTGLAVTTDQYGRFHITCAITPMAGRGSNFMLKLDDRTLPSGFRASTRPFQIQRATRGKTLHFSFGASIFRVVGLDVADGVFAPGSTEMRPQWRPRLELLMTELDKAPAVLRLSYLADVEDASLVKRRVKALTRMISDAWQARDGSYRLSIEHEVFWRMGKPPEKDGRLAADAAPGRQGGTP
ncbi:MAG: SdrD B-like domain-containing protein [Pseudomonadales bacterium]